MALTEAELQNRRKYIGGSDAKVVLQGDAKAWQALRAEKVDDVRPSFDQKTQLLFDVGQAVEPLILREFDRKVPILQVVQHQVWKTDPILAFTPDAITAERREVVQAKFHSGDQSILDLAETYKAQLTHEMLVSNTSRIWLAVIFGHYTRFQHMEVQRDEALVEQYLMKAMEFKQYWATGVLPESMVDEISTMNVPRKRDHVWHVSDNFVAPLCTEIMDNMAQAIIYEDALEKMKKHIKAKKEFLDCGSLLWRNAEGYGVQFKPDSRGAIRVNLAFPPRPKKVRGVPGGPRGKHTGAKARASIDDYESEADREVDRQINRGVRR